MGIGSGEKSDEHEPQPNMTPMIDIVFLLIIFFMIVTEMSQQDIAALELPLSTEAVEDKNPDKERLIINILEDGTVQVKGVTVTVRQLKKLLETEANISREAGRNSPSKRVILIRADKETKYDHVQEVIQYMTEFGIWKLEFGAKQEDQ